MVEGAPDLFQQEVGRHADENPRGHGDGDGPGQKHRGRVGVVGHASGALKAPFTEPGKQTQGWLADKATLEHVVGDEIPRACAMKNGCSTSPMLCLHGDKRNPSAHQIRHPDWVALPSSQCSVARFLTIQTHPRCITMEVPSFSRASNRSASQDTRRAASGAPASPWMSTWHCTTSSTHVAKQAQMAVGQNPGAPGEHQNSFQKWMFIHPKMARHRLCNPWPNVQVTPDFLPQKNAKNNSWIDQTPQQLTFTRSAPTRHTGLRAVSVGDAPSSLSKATTATGSVALKMAPLQPGRGARIVEAWARASVETPALRKKPPAQRSSPIKGPLELNPNEGVHRFLPEPSGNGKSLHVPGTAYGLSLLGRLW